LNIYTQIILGFLLAAAIALVAYRAHSLSRSGAAAATLLGGVIFGLGGLPWAAVLLTFFISSSALSRLARRYKVRLDDKFAKGSQRDWAQVLANGGLGMALVTLQVFFPDNPLIWYAYIGAMAAVNADTWATELGVLSSRRPRLITTGLPVERGTSGGITRLGLMASLAGAGLVGLVGGLVRLPVGPESLALAVGAALLGGLAGSLADSWLGATYQAIYYCPQCEKATERHPFHVCGTPTRQVKGFRWLNNDLVNVACSVVGAAAAVTAAIPIFS
jgi:uncharacterized protein (TIGR00297 family)